jgi:2-polyprenyl-3-methyl-5-hydroxy-6-metoxy-1,4-benzoquinol methylase
MSTSKYHTAVDPQSNTSHAQMLRLVGSNKRVLDVGCSTGYLARELVRQGCTVLGVEYDADAAAEAAPVLERVVVGDLEQLDLAAEFAGDQFDAILFGDVLEHLRDPLPVLRSVRSLLAPGGSVVISVPNIAHADVRLSLLAGKFDYTDVGLLDVTHVRFFTRASLRQFLKDAGMVAVDVSATTADIFGTELGVKPADVDPAVVDRLREDPDATTYQFIVRAVRDDAVQASTEIAWRAAELERELVRVRTELAESRAEVEAVTAELAAAEQRVEDARAEHARAQAAVEAVHQTKVMRSVRIPRAVWGRLRALSDR